MCLIKPSRQISLCSHMKLSFNLTRAGQINSSFVFASIDFKNAVGFENELVIKSK